MFDAADAEHPIEFFEQCLVHSKGEWAGRAFTLAAWQAETVREFFGWKRPDGTRLYRRMDLWVPRKNGKSTFAAGIALYLLVADGEPGAEVYGCANDRLQAQVVFKEAARMVQASPTLGELCQVFQGTSAILDASTSSSYQALSSEAKTKDGLNPHGVVFDEVHELRDLDYWEKMTTAQGSRRQPVMLVISTAGQDRTTIGYREYQEDKKILAGKSKINDRLVRIYEASAADNWRSPRTWRKANPGYGVSVKPDFLKSQCTEAEENAAKEASFKRYHLNIWVSRTTSWISPEKWDLGGEPFDPASLHGKRMFVGLDLSKRSDLTAAVGLVPLERDPGHTFSEPEYFVVPLFFLPSDDIELREKRDGVPYRDWAKAGLVTLTPGNVTDYAFVQKAVMDLARQHEVYEIAHDPWGASQVAISLADEGLTCLEFPQRISVMGPPTKELENLVLQRRIRHGGNPVLRWMVENAAVILDANENVKLVKNRSTGRIDGLVALVMALGRARVAEQSVSAYESGGVKVV